MEIRIIVLLRILVWMSHADKVESVPSGFVELAKSGNTHYCAIADFKRQIYALQFHPEVVHSECGGEILKNFAVKICGADTSWNMRNFAQSEIIKLREKVLGETCGNGADFVSILETPHTYLRPYRLDDLEDLHKILDEKTMYAWGHAFSKQECKDWIEQQLQRYHTYLRPYRLDDLEDLHKILDEKTMYAWGHAFSKQECKDWIEQQLQRYQKYGFGLWAVVDKASGEIIGNAGLNYENIMLVSDETKVDEVDSSGESQCEILELWAVVDKASGEIIGNAGLNYENIMLVSDETKVDEVDSSGESQCEILELGYIINHRFWGQGLGLEVARACAEYAFSKLGAKENFRAWLYYQSSLLGAGLGA